ncbi:MAG: hypothetical protein J6Q53_07970 [Oscillospiraceae bacterium]|nr:hypothetical protein [Oscillospiraceae bacterium]
MSENRTSEANAAILSTWLKALLLLRTVSLVVWLMDYLPLKLTWLSWVDAALSALAILYLFQLGRANRRYQKSAIFRVLCLCYTLYTLASAYFPPSYILALSNFQYSRLLSETVLVIFGVASILAVYQEYHAHADVIKVLDPKLSGNWHTLFICTLGVAILGFTVSLVITMLVDGGYLDISMSVISATFTGVILFVLHLFSILYLHKTVRLLQQ